MSKTKKQLISLCDEMIFSANAGNWLSKAFTNPPEGWAPNPWASGFAKGKQEALERVVEQINRIVEESEEE